jgi:hypothetical protein
MKQQAAQRSSKWKVIEDVLLADLDTPTAGDEIENEEVPQNEEQRDEQPGEMKLIRRSEMPEDDVQEIPEEEEQEK